MILFSRGGIEAVVERVVDVGDLVDDACCGFELAVGEVGEVLAPERLPVGALSLEQLPSLWGQRDVGDAPIFGAAMPLDDVGGFKLVEQRSDGGGVEVRAAGELPGGQFLFAA